MNDKLLVEVRRRFDRMDCGDNSCIYAKDKGGMRTNGGCRCHDRPGMSYMLRALHVITAELLLGKTDDP